MSLIKFSDVRRDVNWPTVWRYEWWQEAGATIAAGVTARKGTVLATHPVTVTETSRVRVLLDAWVYDSTGHANVVVMDCYNATTNTLVGNSMTSISSGGHGSTVWSYVFTQNAGTVIYDMSFWHTAAFAIVVGVSHLNIDVCRA